MPNLAFRFGKQVVDRHCESLANLAFFSRRLTVVEFFNIGIHTSKQLRDFGQAGRWRFAFHETQLAGLRNAMALHNVQRPQTIDQSMLILAIELGQIKLLSCTVEAATRHPSFTKRHKPWHHNPTVETARLSSGQMEFCGPNFGPRMCTITRDQAARLVHEGRGSLC